MEGHAGSPQPTNSGLQETMQSHSSWISLSSPPHQALTPAGAKQVAITKRPFPVLLKKEQATLLPSVANCLHLGDHSSYSKENRSHWSWQGSK